MFGRGIVDSRGDLNTFLKVMFVIFLACKLHLSWFGGHIRSAEYMDVIGRLRIKHRWTKSYNTVFMQ